MEVDQSYDMLGPGCHQNLHKMRDSRLSVYVHTETATELRSGASSITYLYIYKGDTQGGVLLFFTVLYCYIKYSYVQNFFTLA